MEQKFAKWEKLRVKGAWNFVLKYGVAGWGLTTALLFSALIYFAGRSAGASFARVLLPSLVIFPLFGLAWGWAMWALNEKAYLRAKSGGK